MARIRRRRRPPARGAERGVARLQSGGRQRFGNLRCPDNTALARSASLMPMHDLVDGALRQFVDQHENSSLDADS
ncbi:hypothetical protein WT08_17335 [Burkholderia sp. MSMB1552]|nr:hypothetical protein WT08_17335 [Burkholderia sp. MSMB1552]KWZ49499.1 hypothetical protein WS92_18535 [Burkholderia sp. MSMB1588]